MPFNDHLSVKKTGKESRILSVGNLPPDVDQLCVRKVFERYGRILAIKFAEEKEIKFAIVSFIDTKTAVKAHTEVNKIGEHILVSSFYIPGKPLREEFLEALNQRHENDVQLLKEKEQVSSCFTASTGSLTAATPTNARDRKPTDCVFHAKQPSLDQFSAVLVSTILVSGLPDFPAELCVRERLYFLLRKYGPVSAVKINFESPPTALVRFHSKEDALLAIDELDGKLDLWGRKLSLCLHSKQVTVDSDMSVEDDVVYCDKATRTLYAGNLPSGIQESDLKALFEIFGNIWMIDIKRHNNVTPYAFIYFGTIRSVARTMRIMNGQQFQRQTLKLGFGRGQPAKSLWLGSLPRCTDLASLSEFTGVAQSSILYDREGREAVIVMPDVTSASTLVESIRRKKLHGSRVEIDFAPKEFLNCSVFAQSIDNRFPSMSGDCFDLICKYDSLETRKRVLKDLSCADMNGGSIPSTSSVSPDSTHSEVVMASPKLFQNPIQTLPSGCDVKLSPNEVINPAGVTGPSLAAFGDVDMRFDPSAKLTVSEKRPLSTVDHTISKHRKLGILGGVPSTVNSDGIRESSVNAKVPTASVPNLMDDVRLLLNLMISKITLSVERTHKAVVRAYEYRRQYNWSPVLHVCCLSNCSFCQCCCFRFLFGDRVFGRSVLQVAACTPLQSLKTTGSSIECQLRKSRFYCVASFDQQFCRAPVKLPAYNVCCLEKTKVHCYFLSSEDDYSYELKTLCGCNVTSDESIAVVFAEL